jgi:hypothetical protein
MASFAMEGELAPGKMATQHFMAATVAGLHRSTMGRANTSITKAACSQPGPLEVLAMPASSIKFLMRRQVQQVCCKDM